MKVDVTDVSSYQRKLQFTVPADTVRTELNAAFKTLSGQASLKGFRKGKAPR